MKKGTKIGLGLAGLLMGVVALSGCTNSFCTVVDKTHILYAIDHGVSQYYATEEEAQGKIPEGASETSYKIGKVDSENANLWYYASFDNCKNLQKVVTNASKSNISTPSLSFYVELDNVVLRKSLEKAQSLGSDAKMSTLTVEQVGSASQDGLLREFGYLKFYGNAEKEKNRLFENWELYCNEVRTSTWGSEHIDECPNKDFVTYYRSQMNSAISAYRSCLATKGGYYGKYGGEEIAAEISEKNWGFAWSKVGFLSGLLVYPIGWLIDVMTTGFLNGVGQGWAQLLAIFFVTLIVRSIMLLATFKQTTASSRMQELQPEISKIQAKYPNSNTNQYERQRMAQETQALYKKHKINPFTSIIVMIVQFPVFICVWGAMQGSAQLSSGSVLGLNLSESISSVLTTWSNWKDPASGVWTALGLFLLMAAAQTVAMLLPQWLAKAQKKKIAKLGRNPAQKESDNKMKWFTYIMLAMIIFMGFSLVSALGVYWFVGALFSIGQTLITHAIMNRKRKNR